MIRQYLLDANIVIMIWNNYPKLFDIIEKDNRVNFSVPQCIAQELCKKEFDEIDGIPILSNKFLKLINHIIKDDIDTINKNDKHNFKIKYHPKSNSYIINGIKISNNDYKIICICENNEGYTLVTGDKNANKSAESILGPSRVMNFEDFITDLKKNGILSEENCSPSSKK